MVILTVSGASYLSDNTELCAGVFQITVCDSVCVTLVVVLRPLLAVGDTGSLPVLSSVDEDVPGATSPPLLDICPHLPHHAGAQAGLQDPLELVPHLPPCLDL